MDRELRKSSWWCAGCPPTIIQSLSQSCPANSHNIIQPGVKTAWWSMEPGLYKTIHHHVKLNIWQTWNPTQRTYLTKTSHKSVEMNDIFFFSVVTLFFVSGWTQATFFFSLGLRPWSSWWSPLSRQSLWRRHPPSFLTTRPRWSLRSWWRLQCKCGVRRWFWPGRWWPHREI